MSHPTWVRGLKQANAAIKAEMKSSHPTWVRGLKHAEARKRLPKAMSHPTWVRGLKPLVAVITALLNGVAPYVGAWIETGGGARSIRPITRRTLRGCVD